MTHYYRIKKWLPERYKQQCRVLVSWSKNGNIMIEFADGWQVVCPRYSVRLLPKN